MIVLLEVVYGIFLPSNDCFGINKVTELYPHKNPTGFFHCDDVIRESTIMTLTDM